MNSTKVQNPPRYGGAHSAQRVQISGVHNTHERTWIRSCRWPGVCQGGWV